MTINSTNTNAIDGHVPPGDYTVLTVSDDGIGMDEAAIERALILLTAQNGLRTALAYQPCTAL